MTPLKVFGVEVVLTPGGGLKLRGSGQSGPRAVEYVRAHRAEILAALSQSGRPGECESCPAAGHWDYSTYASLGLLCFHQAFYLGKPGKPKPCQHARADCPRK